VAHIAASLAGVDRRAVADAGDWAETKNAAERESRGVREGAMSGSGFQRVHPLPVLPLVDATANPSFLPTAPDTRKRMFRPSADLLQLIQRRCDEGRAERGSTT
jgi:hypothetical protein